MKRGLAALIVTAALSTAACTDQLEGTFGQDLFNAGCAHCHREDLGGGTGPPLGPGSDADLELSDLQIADVIRVGPGRMPSFGRRLTDQQIDSLVAYLRSQQRGSEIETASTGS